MSASRDLRIMMRQSNHSQDRQSLIWAKRCPECRASLVNDTQSGEIICSKCGIVVDQIEDTGPESIVYDDARDKVCRASGSTSYTMHDLGIATDIPDTKKDYSGKTIASNVANQMGNMRKWQQRIRVSNRKDRRLLTILTKINEICHSIKLPDNVRETSSILYRDLSGKIDIKGRSVTAISIAVIYIACKRCHMVKSMEEITRGVSIPSEVRARVKLASKYYRFIMMETNSVVPVLTMDKYISRLANYTKTDVRVQRLALDMAEKTKNLNITDGKEPNGVAAAYLYISATLMGLNMRQRYISTVSGVTEVTIRSRCRDILSGRNLRITLRPAKSKRV